jgi:hypothetical protein
MDVGVQLQLLKHKAPKGWAVVQEIFLLRFHTSAAWYALIVIATT